MNQAFQTPWRVAVIGEDLNTVVNSDIVTSVNPMQRTGTGPL